MLKSLKSRCLLIALACSPSLASYAYTDSTGASVSEDNSSLAGRTVKDSGSPDEDAGAKLESVVVTAQRRIENLQVVPISAQVIGNQILTEQNYNSLEELTEVVPSVHIGNSDGFSNDLYIRGIGSGENQSFDQSVAMFADDIYHGRSRMSGATFLDLDRIEILKGPQSTFFGNNAIAGALNIVTKKPGDTVDAWARALYGEYGQYALEGGVSGPITDWFGMRLAVTRNGDSGWIDNENTDRHEPDENNEAARLTMLFHPNDSLDATLKLEGGDNRSNVSGSQPGQWNLCPPPAPFSATNSGPGLGTCAQALALGIPIGIDQNNVSALGGQGNSLSTFESVLTINYTQWGHTFTSVSGFYNYHFDANDAPSELPVTLLTTNFPEKYHQFSQELRVASPTGQTLEYLAGAYVQTDQLASEFNLNLPGLNPVVESVPPFAPLVPYLPLAEASTFSQGEHVDSVFGSLNWNVTDRLRLNAGLRGSSVKKDDSGEKMYGTGTKLYGGFVPMPVALQNLAGVVFGPPGTSQPLNRTDRAWMPSAGIQYQLDSDAMLYFSYRKGFKAGGFNATDVISPPQMIEFGPEHVNAYELGLKSKWLDDRLLVNLDVFRSNYRGLQVNAAIPTGPPLNTTVAEVRNAASSVSQGVELETQWAVSKAFRLGANVTYLESYYVSYPNAPPTTLQNFCAANSGAGSGYVLPYCSIFPNPVPGYASLDGEATLYAPRWSGSVWANYSILIAGGYRFTTLLSPYFSSSYNKDPQLDAIGLGYLAGTDGYIRLDGKLTLQTPDGRWALDLIGKNLTSRVIVTSLTSFPTATKEEPRNVALQARFKW
jgi:iron complex outermembrane receptor protein